MKLLDDLTRIFYTYNGLSELFQLTQRQIRKLTPTIDTIPVWWYINGIPASSGIDVNIRRLGNWTFPQTNIAVVIVDLTKTGIV